MPADLNKRSVRPLLPEKAQLSDVKWPLEKGAIRILWLLLLLCPFWWWIDKVEPKKKKEREAQEDKWNQQRAYWVTGWLVLLGVIWLVNPASSPWKWLFAFLAVVRLLEIFTTGLGTILQQETQVRARNLLTIAIYAVQITLIFAILDHSLATTDFVAHGAHATRASDYLYISWSDMTTIGNNVYVPQNDAARYLELLTTTSGLLLVGVLVAFGIGSVNDGETR